MVSLLKAHVQGVDPTVVSPGAISWETEPLLTFRRSAETSEAIGSPCLIGIGRETLNEMRLL